MSKASSKSVATTVDLEMVPATSETLDSISAQVREIQHTFADKTRTYMREVVYDVVAIGLFLLKAEMVHLLSSRPETVSGRRQKRGSKGQMEAGDGFTKWLAANHPDIEERTARNYRNAARRVGLTSSSTLADVESLRQEQKLHDQTLTALYKPLALPGDAPPQETLPPVNLVAQVFANSRTVLGELRAVKEEMGPDEYESVCAMLREELEAFTERAWEITDREPSIDATEHGEVTLGVEGRARIAREQRERWAKQAAKKGGRK